MKNLEVSQNEKPTPEEMIKIIEDVINEEYVLFKTETMADYSADFPEEGEPFLYNIWAKEEYKELGLGYIVFHDFLRKAGVNKTFNSTALTESGAKMFAKAVETNLIEKVSNGPFNFSKWKVTKDPEDSLRKIQESWEDKTS
jgi:hypothetical protein